MYISSYVCFSKGYIDMFKYIYINVTWLTTYGLVLNLVACSSSSNTRTAQQFCVIAWRCFIEYFVCSSEQREQLNLYSVSRILLANENSHAFSEIHIIYSSLVACWPECLVSSTFSQHRGMFRKDNSLDCRPADLSSKVYYHVVTVSSWSCKAFVSS